MKKSINTRTQYRIVGSDYSAQEPRMTTFLSGDPKMYEAYTTGKDLYAIIAQSAYHNNYEDNLEFYPEGTEIEIDGKKVICGYKTHLNKSGKERRSTGKILNLAATYGMGGAAAGSKLGYTGKEAQEKGQELLDNFFAGFSKVKEAIDQSKEYLKKNGYVEDFVGRRRRLPDINLEPYTARYLDETKAIKDTFNPFLNCQDRILLNEDITIWNQILLGYCILNNTWKLMKAQDITQVKIVEEVSNNTFEWLSNIAFNPVKNLNLGCADPKKPVNNFKNKSNKQKILSDMELLKSILKTKTYKDVDLGANIDFANLLQKYISRYKYSVPMQIPETKIKLTAYTTRIAQASRQCLNARIQGSAASLTKIAMVDLADDLILKKLQAKLIITVHDEVLLECPEYYAEDASKRISEIMTHAATKVGDNVPQSCDPYIVTRWYADEYAATILDEFKKLEKTKSREESIEQIYKNHSEIPQEALLKTLETGCDLDF